MSRYKNIKLASKEEKGNKAPFPKNNDTILTIINKNRNKLKKILQYFNSLNSSNGKIIFILKYIGKIPPTTSRMIFGKKPKNLQDVKQKTIKTFVKNNSLITHLYYSINIETYNKFRTQLKTLLGWSKISEMPKNSLKNEILNIPQKLLLVDKVLSQDAPNFINAPRAVKVIYIKEIIDALFLKNILTKENFDFISNVAFLNEEQYSALYNLYPEIIVNISFKEEYEIPQININDFDIPLISLSNDWNNTIIGVIDAGCDLPLQFQPFILSNIDNREYNKSHNFEHGSCVASLIIANDELNPKDKDNLGHFRIKHFEILQKNEHPTSHWHIIKYIKKIIKSNLDIKIWNLSMNALKNPYSLNVSSLGILLDKLSYEHDILFVVSSGNFRSSATDWKKSLGLPADALNVLSVGSVKYDIKNIVHPEKYSSFGPILHFEKPEVSHYGGPYNKSGLKIGMHSSNGIIYGNKGTSFSAPRVSRLAANYIENGFTPFEAKAKIISLAILENRNRRKNELGWKSAAYGHLTNMEDNSLTLKMTLELSNIKPQYFPIKMVDGIEEISITSSTRISPKPWLGEEYSTSNIELSLVWYKDSQNPEYHKQTLMVKKDILTDNKKYGSEIIKRFDGGKWFSTTKVASSIKAINEKRQCIIEQKNIANPKLAIRIRKQDLFRTIKEQKEIVSIVIAIKGKFDMDLFEKENINIIEQEIYINV